MNEAKGRGVKGEHEISKKERGDPSLQKGLREETGTPNQYYGEGREQGKKIKDNIRIGQR